MSRSLLLPIAGATACALGVAAIANGCASLATADDWPVSSGSGGGTVPSSASGSAGEGPGGSGGAPACLDLPQAVGRWVRGGGSEAHDDFDPSLAVDSQGHAFLLARVEAQADLGGGPLEPSAPPDLVLAEYEGGGAHVGSVSFAGADVMPIDVAITPEDNLVVAGGFLGTLSMTENETSAGGKDIFLAELSTTEPGYPASWVRRYGGSGNEVAHAVAVDKAGIVMAGATDLSTSFGNGNSVDEPALFLAKFNFDASVSLWAIAIGTPPNTEGRGLALALDADGNPIVGGPYGADDHAFISKFSSTGDVTPFRVEISGDLAQAVVDIAVDANGNVAFAGSCKGQTHLQSLVRGADISCDEAGDAIVGLLDNDGDLVWYRVLADTLEAEQTAIGVAFRGCNVLVVGEAHGSIDLGDGEKSVTEIDAFWAEYQLADGAFVRGKLMAELGPQSAVRAVARGGGIWLAGNYMGTMNFDGQVTPSSQDDWDLFLAKLEP